MKKVIVIGGGSSGLMAAISASKTCDVTIIEKQGKLGTKLLISGGGRCNVTNSKPIDEIINNVVGNGKFLYSSLNSFSNKDIINFFETRGLKLKEEDNGRLFPVTDKSRDVLKVLENQLNKSNVKIKYNTQIIKVNKNEDNSISCIIDSSGNKYVADHYIFALGGKSYSQVGTTGDGYPMLEKLGHTINTLYPVEVPLVSNDSFIQSKELMGLSFQDISISVLNKKGKKVVTHNHDIIFTHFGISGPGALRCSSQVYKFLKKDMISIISIDFIPNYSNEALSSLILEKINEHSDKLALNVLSLIINKKVSSVILKSLNINENSKAKQLKQRLDDLVQNIKNFNIAINSTQGFSKSFVTGGGVKIKEIDPKTLRSKICSNLSICGEIIDINAHTGGYNITAAFTTGYNAGKNI